MNVRRLLPQTRTDVVLSLCSAAVELGLLALFMRRYFYPR